MDSPIIGGLLAAGLGVAVSWLNARLSERMLRKNPRSLGAFPVLRQALNIAYLTGVFLLARVLPWEAFPLLLGAALGLSISSILFALRLMKLNNALNGRETPEGEKGEDASGQDL